MVLFFNKRAIKRINYTNRYYTTKYNYHLLIQENVIKHDTKTKSTRISK